MQLETRRYILTGITEMLGTKACNPDVYTSYIASKAPDGALTDDEIDALDGDPDRGKTVMPRNPRTCALCIQDYMVRGYIKSSLEALTAATGVKAPRTKVDRYLFVAPRMIDLRRPGGGPIREADGTLERSMRVMTMQGPRVSVASSEQVDRWEIEVEITLLPNAGTRASAALTWDAVEEALNYGRLCGIGQWRNGSYGRFAWRRADAEEAVG